jgi:hypothetical protein
MTLRVMGISEMQKCGVCNLQSEGQVRASDTTGLEGGHLGAHLISICEAPRPKVGASQAGTTQADIARSEHTCSKAVSLY